MCEKTQDIEYYSSTEVTDILDMTDLQWPFEQIMDTKLIVACDICYYPITFEEHVIDEIRDENNVSFGLVIPIRKLFKNVGIFSDNPLDEWQTRVFCSNCGLILSFLNPHRHRISVSNFEKVIGYVGLDEQVVILWKTPLFRGSEMEACCRFMQINGF